MMSTELHAQLSYLGSSNFKKFVNTDQVRHILSIYAKKINELRINFIVCCFLLIVSLLIILMLINIIAQEHSWYPKNGRINSPETGHPQRIGSGPCH